MIRRFVNLVVENYKTGVYSLHRLDVSKHLFHQSRADAARVVPFLLASGDDSSAGSSGDDEQPTLLDSLEELPAPCVKIHPFFRDEPAMEKLPFGGFLSPRSSEDKFICMNWMGDTVLCHADKPSVDPMPHLRDEVGMDPISFTAARPDAAQDHQEEEDLYVIHHVPDRGATTNTCSCFRVLRKDKDAGNGGWRWESLPAPPFIGDPRYQPALFMYSYTLVDDGRTLCFSCASPGIGTYYFDTVERQWRHAGGDWLLPFVGGAEYVPDLALWLGFSPCRYLCGTSDLNAMSIDHPPKLQYVWQDIVTPENWFAGRTKLISLGSGRFCIAKDFVVENRRTGGEYGEEWWELDDEVTVLTGIEIEMGRDDDDDESRLKVWKHKSLRFNSSSTFSVKRVL